MFTDIFKTYLKNIKFNYKQDKLQKPPLHGLLPNNQIHELFPLRHPPCIYPLSLIDHIFYKLSDDEWDSLDDASDYLFEHQGPQGSEEE